MVMNLAIRISSLTAGAGLLAGFTKWLAASPDPARQIPPQGSLTKPVGLYVFAVIRAPPPWKFAPSAVIGLARTTGGRGSGGNLGFPQ